MTNQICEPTSSLIIANEHSKSGLKALLEAGISFTVDTIRATLKNQRTFRTNRAAFRQMLKLEDNILQDIGVTRDDIVWASNLPISKNAALELNSVATARRSARRKR